MGAIRSPIPYHAPETTHLTTCDSVIAGGDDHRGIRLSSAELYDPNTDQFLRTGSVATARLTEHSSNAVCLKDGKVLIAGGYGIDSRSPQIAVAEIYDPEQGGFFATSNLAVARACHTMTLLPNGKVLIAGGYQDAGGHLASAELYKLDTGSFTLTTSMSAPHFYHTATLLPNDMVLVVGGYSSLVELYDPRTDTFRSCGQVFTARHLHTAVLLPDGRVLLVGGRSQYSGSLTSLELSSSLCS